MTAGEPRIPGTVKGLSLVSLFNDFASEMVYPLLPAFITRTLGGGATILGALDGAAELAAAGTKLLSGRLADRPGWRRGLVLAGYLAAVVVRPVIGLASAAAQVVGLRVIDRLGKGIRTPARDAMIADATAPEIRGRAFGLHRAADHLGSVPGALAAWWLLAMGVGVREVIAWSALPGLLAFLVLWLVLRQPQAVARTVTANRTAASGPTFWPPVIALALLVLARLPETLLLLRIQDLGVTVAAVPLVWAALHVVRTLSSYPGGWLSDRSGPRWVVASGGLCFALAAGMLLGLVAGLTESAERVMVARLSPARMGRGFGAYHAVTGLVALPAALTFGMIYDRVGGGAAALTCSGAILAATLVWLGLAPSTTAEPKSS